METQNSICDFRNVDCVTFMRTLPDKYFDLCIADPPYGIDIANNPFRGKFEKTDWDSKVPTHEFFNEIFRVSKNQIIWGGNYFGLPANKHFIIWDKMQPFDFSSAMCEYAWSSLNKPAKIFRKRVVEDKGKIHPTQKPVELYSWIIRNYANHGDKIFDPMVGSGSSMIAAYFLGFEFTGCEISKEYYDKAKERFDKVCNNTFAQSGKTFVQTTLFN